MILVGLSIGSGEFVLWPRLTAEWGFALFWACWIGVTLQFFINMEIERWSLATGESAVIGFVRLHRFYAPVFLLCATVPWVWPGWATGGATLLHWQLGLPIQITSIAGLVLCGLILSLGPVVYRTVETIQITLVALIVVLLGGLAIAVVRVDDVLALLAGAAQVGHVPDGVALPMLLGALAFAGAGGSVNLAQSELHQGQGLRNGILRGSYHQPLHGTRGGVEQRRLRVRRYRDRSRALADLVAAHESRALLLLLRAGVADPRGSSVCWRRRSSRPVRPSPRVLASFVMKRPRSRPASAARHATRSCSSESRCCSRPSSLYSTRCPGSRRTCWLCSSRRVRVRRSSTSRSSGC